MGNPWNNAPGWITGPLYFFRIFKHYYDAAETGTIMRNGAPVGGMSECDD